jgi:hypothetical protein
MSSYATAKQFEAYVEGWVTTDEDALARLLERATRDVDVLLGARATLRSGDYAGHKIDPTRLATWEQEALARATCAQAEYRYELGEAALVGAGSEGAKRVKGPDFEVEYPAGPGGGRQRFGGKVANELEPIRHLIPTTARLR